MDDQQQLLRARALGGDEAALDELLQASLDECASAERERDLAIRVVDAIRTLGAHLSVSGACPVSSSVSCMNDLMHPQLVADWDGLMAYPSSSKLRCLVLWLYMTMGLMLAAAPDIRVGVS